MTNDRHVVFNIAATTPIIYAWEWNSYQLMWQRHMSIKEQVRGPLSVPVCT